MPGDLVAIDPLRCKGHGVCVAVCPARVFEQVPEGALPRVVRPEACIRCGHCVAACPTEAVQVRGVRLLPETPRQPVRPEDLLALLRHRRSVRRMRDEPVPREIIQQVVQAASLAPTAKNSRAVRITVVQDAALRRALVEASREAYRLVLAGRGGPARLALLGVLAPERAEVEARVVDNVRGLVENLDAGRDVLLYDAPVLLIFSAPADWGTSPVDCSLAMMNAMLMAESLGLGTCVTGYFQEAIRHSLEMRRQLQIPDEEQTFGALSLGYPTYAMRRQLDRRRFRVNWL